MRPGTALPTLPPRVQRLVGLLTLLGSAYWAMGGHLWAFGPKAPHRFTAMAMLTGSLKLRNGVWNVGPDEQVFNGAGYTNWGFGVPLLQAPFHYLAAVTRGLPWAFFPDRAIYFIYLGGVIAVLWLTLDRLLAARGVTAARGALSWSATLLVLGATVYPLMSCRFLIYEETICYLILCELLALGGYVFATSSWGSRPLLLMGVAAGMGLLVRPTGLVLLGVWAAVVALESKSLRASAVFGAAAAPFVAFWLYTNTVRSGSPLALGISNSLPHHAYHVQIVRFGCRCADTPVHALQAAASLFREIFLWSSDAPDAPWLTACHFGYERQLSDGRLYPHEGFLGIPVLLLLVWSLVTQMRMTRGRARVSALAPFLGMALLFASYVHGVSTFAWRYVGDFWPLIVLACVQFVRVLPPGANRLGGRRAAAALALLGALTCVRHVLPNLPTIKPLTPGDARLMSTQFTTSRWAPDPPMPSRLECGAVNDLPYENGYGWDPACKVDTFTNVYLGVPAKEGAAYVLRFVASDVDSPTLRVYANGGLYTAHRQGEAYTAELEIHRDALAGPAVMITVEWTRDFDPPPAKMLSIELL
jgi:hypothetical protein